MYSERKGKTIVILEFTKKLANHIICKLLLAISCGFMAITLLSTKRFVKYKNNHKGCSKIIKENGLIMLTV